MVKMHVVKKYDMTFINKSIIGIKGIEQCGMCCYINVINLGQLYDNGTHNMINTLLPHGSFFFITYLIQFFTGINWIHEALRPL